LLCQQLTISLNNALKKSRRLDLLAMCLWMSYKIMVECTAECMLKNQWRLGLPCCKNSSSTHLRHRVLELLSKHQKAAHFCCKALRHLHNIRGVFSEWHTQILNNQMICIHLIRDLQCGCNYIKELKRICIENWHTFSVLPLTVWKFSCIFNMLNTNVIFLQW
jgi:hypothetical protein